MKQPFFSVIIPVFNRADSVKVTLYSLKEQTFTDFETILVDDCSTDNSYQVAKDFDLPKKRVLRNEVNSERSISRNRGIQEARGEYICFIDSDDYHLPNHLEVLYNAITDKGAPEAVFFTNAWNEDENGVRSERVCPDFAEYDPFYYLLRYTPNPQRWAVHHTAFNQVLFDPEIPGLEDFDWLLRAKLIYPFYQIKKRTTVYVQHKDSYSQSADRAVKELRYFDYIFNKPMLKEALPAKGKNRLLSMCHYHLAVEANHLQQKTKFYNHASRSFLLYPKGYNGRTNKPLLVLSLYNLPLVGELMKQAVRTAKAIKVK